MIPGYQHKDESLRVEPKQNATHDLIRALSAFFGNLFQGMDLLLVLKNCKRYASLFQSRDSRGIQEIDDWHAAILPQGGLMCRLAAFQENEWCGFFPGDPKPLQVAGLLDWIPATGFDQRIRRFWPNSGDA